MEQVWVNTPAQLPAGAPADHPGLAAPSDFKASEAVITIGQSQQGSNKFDMVMAIDNWRQGYEGVRSHNKQPER
jgi:hypothetical protein